ncbi:hypothetical protein CsSME_00009387 [Camellia sinensis var. sinensis]
MIRIYFSLPHCFLVGYLVSLNFLAFAVFVETLDKCFSNVCELDIVFNFNKVHTILDEIVLGGQVLETSSSEVMKAVEEISKCSLSLSLSLPLSLGQNKVHDTSY